MGYTLCMIADFQNLLISPIFGVFSPIFGVSSSGFFLRNTLKDS